MAFDPQTRLDVGDTFPDLALDLPDGNTISVPGDYDGRWLVLLFYRGHF